MIYTCCILHNICIDQNDSGDFVDARDFAEFETIHRAINNEMEITPMQEYNGVMDPPHPTQRQEEASYTPPSATQIRNMKEAGRERRRAIVEELSSRM